jgi:MFS family permease
VDQRRLGVIAALGTAQTLAWGSSYYLPAILADPIAHDLGISSNWFFAAFSASLVISGLLGPRVGRQIDRVGGRQVLCISNLLLAGGLALLGASTSLWMMAAAWLLLGIGMGLGLYDAAFGALGRIYGSDARSAITGITLIAGFASTVGWPLSSLGLETIGWRETCYAWAVAHIVIGLPLNLSLPRAATRQVAEGPVVKAHIPIDQTMVLLSLAFAAAWTVTSAMAAHLPRIVEAFGATPAQAVFAGMMIGPAQVGARIMEASLLSFSSHRVHAACLHHSSHRRVRDRDLWRRGRGRLRPAARRGQRHLDDRTRHASPCDLRPRELRLPAWTDRCAIPHLPSRGAARFWSLDRAHGQAGGCGVGRPQSRGAGRTDGVAPIGNDRSDRARGRIRRTHD